MASPCASSFTGGSSSCIETTISPAGVIKSNLIVKPYYPAGYVASNAAVLNPSQLTTNTVKGIVTTVAASLDPNVLICLKGGAAVLAGKTDSLLLFKNSVTNELIGDVIIAPPPNILNPCDPTQPNKNALRLTSAGLEVTTQGIPFTVTDAASCAGAYTYVDCSSGELKVYIQVAPEVLGDACRPLTDAAGNAIQRNALTCTPAGLAVLTGKGDNAVETYVDCLSKELRAKLILKPDDGCNTAARKGKNALTQSAEGAAVLTGTNTLGGIETFRDCTTNELWARLIVKPAPTNSSCDINPDPNALRIFDDGVGVLTGKGDGCIETYVDCDTQALFARLLINKTAVTAMGKTVNTPQNGLACGSEGAAVLVGNNPTGGVHLYADASTNVVYADIILKDNPSASNCDPLQIKNALRKTESGLAVEVGDSTCIDMYVDCPTGEIRAVPKFNAETNKVLSCAADGIMLHLASGCNGLKIKSDGLFATPAPPTGYFGFQSDGFGDTMADDASFSGPTKTVTISNPSDSCRQMVAVFFFRAPTVAMAYNSATGDQAKFSYSGTIGAVPIGQEYATFQAIGTDPFYLKFPGPTEIYYVNLAPGQATTATITPHIELIGDASATMGSYSVSGFAAWQGSI